MSDGLSHIAEEVRRQDWERFICALFAPAAARDALLALLAFNLEVARTREVVSEALLGEMRLQWWSDRIADIFEDPAKLPSGNPTLTALAGSIIRHGLDRRLFDELIEARRADLYDQPPVSLNQLEVYGCKTAGGLFRLQMQAVGGSEPNDQTGRSADIAGAVWTLTGILRALGPLADAGRNLIPAELRSEFELHEFDFRRRQSTPSLIGCVERIAARGEALLAEARSFRAHVPPGQRAVLLPLALSGQFLNRLRARKFDPFRPGLEAGKVSRQLRVLFSAARRGY